MRSNKTNSALKLPRSSVQFESVKLPMQTLGTPRINETAAGNSSTLSQVKKLRLPQESKEKLQRPSQAFKQSRASVQIDPSSRKALRTVQVKSSANSSVERNTANNLPQTEERAKMVRKQQLASQIMQINLKSLNQVQEYVNQTVRIRGMSQTEALAMVNLSNVEQKNKEYLFAEIISASKGQADKKVDHVQVLQTIAQCLEDITQTDLKEHARRNRSSLSIEEHLAERKRAERAVDRLHQKLGIKKYHRTFASVEKARPDLLDIKGYIEGLPEEIDERDSLERAKYIKKLTQNVNIYAFLKDCETNSQGSQMSQEERMEQRQQFKKTRKLQAKMNRERQAAQEMKLLETQDGDSSEKTPGAQESGQLSIGRKISSSMSLGQHLNSSELKPSISKSRQRKIQPVQSQISHFQSIRQSSPGSSGDNGSLQRTVTMGNDQNSHRSPDFSQKMTIEGMNGEQLSQRSSPRVAASEAGYKLRPLMKQRRSVDTDMVSENFFTSKQAQQLVNLRIKQSRVEKSSKYYHKFTNLKQLDQQVQFNQHLHSQFQANEGRNLNRGSSSGRQSPTCTSDYRPSEFGEVKSTMTKVDKAIIKFNKEMAKSSKRQQIRKSLFQSKPSVAPNDDRNTTAQLESVMKSIDKIRHTPKRRKRKKLRSQFPAEVNKDGIPDLPFSMIDHEAQSQVTYQMSDVPFHSRGKLSEYQPRASSLESGSSNEYNITPEPQSEFFQRASTIMKGSELYINDDSNDNNLLDTLPIDLSKLKITTDAFGQIQVADKEQRKQIEQAVDTYFGAASQISSIVGKGPSQAGSHLSNASSILKKSRQSVTVLGKHPTHGTLLERNSGISNIRSLSKEADSTAKERAEILDTIYEVKNTIKDQDNLPRKKKNNDRNFEMFKEYNKKLLQFPTAPDPFLAHKREQFKKLNPGEGGSNVFDRLTFKKQPQGASEESMQSIQKLSSRSVEKPQTNSANQNSMLSGVINDTATGIYMRMNSNVLNNNFTSQGRNNKEESQRSSDRSKNKTSPADTSTNYMSKRKQTSSTDKSMNGGAKKSSGTNSSASSFLPQVTRNMPAPSTLNKDICLESLTETSNRAAAQVSGGNQIFKMKSVGFNTVKGPGGARKLPKTGTNVIMPGNFRSMSNLD